LQTIELHANRSSATVCLDFVIPRDEWHLRRTLRQWSTHYNSGRPHRALGPGIPDAPDRKLPLGNGRHEIPRKSFHASSANPVGTPPAKRAFSPTAGARRADSYETVCAEFAHLDSQHAERGEAVLQATGEAAVVFSGCVLLSTQATIGSTLAARAAGTQDARSAAAQSNKVAIVSIRGSHGLCSRSNLTA
jgi:hypothetical protein